MKICPDIFAFFFGSSSIDVERRESMRLILSGSVAAMMCTVVADARALRWQPDPGLYTNEEQVYFEGDASRTPPRWIGLRIAKDSDGTYRFESIDRFGNAVADRRLLQQLPDIAFGGMADEDIIIRGYREDKIKQDLVLRRARPATCWAAVLKDKPKADGKPDWHFVRDVKVHDQGGRATIGGGDTGATPIVIRIRNVIWPPPSTNKPSIVLYVHKPDQPDRAESYVWADPGAARIGINLRWMQASCGIDGAEAPSQVTATTFRG
jgi:hypothetical protein